MLRGLYICGRKTKYQKYELSFHTGTSWWIMNFYKAALVIKKLKSV